jgi:hypothetical protein
MQARAAEIEAWVGRVAATYNVLPMDAETFRRWARLMHRRSDDFIEDAISQRRRLPTISPW